MDKYILRKDGVLEKESVNRVRTDYPRINEAETIEEILCFSTLIAKRVLDHTNTTANSKAWYNRQKDGCSSCRYNNVCLACIINE